MDSHRSTDDESTRARYNLKCVKHKRNAKEFMSHVNSGAYQTNRHWCTVKKLTIVMRPFLALQMK